MIRRLVLQFGLISVGLGLAGGLALADTAVNANASNAAYVNGQQAQSPAAVDQGNSTSTSAQYSVSQTATFPGSGSGSGGAPDGGVSGGGSQVNPGSLSIQNSGVNAAGTLQNGNPDPLAADSSGKATGSMVAGLAAGGSGGNSAVSAASAGGTSAAGSAGDTGSAGPSATPVLPSAASPDYFGEAPAVIAAAVAPLGFAAVLPVMLPVAAPVAAHTSPAAPPAPKPDGLFVQFSALMAQTVVPLGHSMPPLALSLALAAAVTLCDYFLIQGQVRLRLTASLYIMRLRRCGFLGAARSYIEAIGTLFATPLKVSSIGVYTL